MDTQTHAKIDNSKQIHQPVPPPGATARNIWKPSRPPEWNILRNVTPPSRRPTFARLSLFPTRRVERQCAVVVVMESAAQETIRDARASAWEWGLQGAMTQLTATWIRRRKEAGSLLWRCVKGFEMQICVYIDVKQI